MLTRCAASMTQTVRRFHNDEAGNESLQTIMIMAVGAMVMVGLVKIWDGNIKGEVVAKLVDMFKQLF